MTYRLVTLVIVGENMVISLFFEMVVSDVVVSKWLEAVTGSTRRSTESWATGLTGPFFPLT